ncbi:MAG: hypothetical protein JWQ75_2413 [Pseudarthrobacter sp.]|nr:hypothetical protein [Pseudarthrobacter sp.]
MVVSEIEVLALTPGQSSDPAAASISVEGQALSGFDPSVTAYQIASRGKIPAVTAASADPYATVSVQQATKANGTAVVTVTSEDGTQTRTYQITVGA